LNDLFFYDIKGKMITMKTKSYNENNLLTKKVIPVGIDDFKVPKKGTMIQGKVLTKDGPTLYVDLGPSKVGIVYGREYQRAKDIIKNLKPEDEVLVKVVDEENEDGFIELSIQEAYKEKNWEKIKELKESQEPFKIKVLKVNKGGLISEVSGIPAFLPTSQLASYHYPRIQDGNKSEIFKKLQTFIGKELEVTVFDYDQENQQIILSEFSKENETLKEAIASLRVGDEVVGEISGIVNFGAFLKFTPPIKEDSKEKISPPVLEGLIHISEIDWQLIEHPSQVLKVGQVVRAKIIDISQGRISLSMRALKKDPWQELELKPGDKVIGKVVKFNPFGAFVQLRLDEEFIKKFPTTPKIQGLIHISEFGSEEKMKEELEIDKEYEFSVLKINPQKHWMALRLNKEQKEDEKNN
jgi:small subunit ribosomal protein S1